MPLEKVGDTQFEYWVLPDGMTIADMWPDVPFHDKVTAIQHCDAWTKHENRAYNVTTIEGELVES